MTSQVALFMFKFKNGFLPSIFHNYCREANYFHSYRTRSADLYRPHIFSSDLARNTIKTQGPLLWNSISITIRNCMSSKSFSSKYMYFLISQYNNLLLCFNFLILYLTCNPTSKCIFLISLFRMPQPTYCLSHCLVLVLLLHLVAMSLLIVSLVLARTLSLCR